MRLLFGIICLFKKHEWEYKTNQGYHCKRCHTKRVGIVDFSSIMQSSISLTGFDALKK